MPNLFGMHCINPVGRYFNQSVYVHKDFAHLIPHKIDMEVLNERAKELPTDFEYTLIRYDRGGSPDTVCVSFIQVHDFDDSNDPIGGDSWYIKGQRYLDNGESHRFTSAKKDPQIYHHKWVYVPESYAGFNWKQAMQWSERWLSRRMNDWSFSSADLARLSHWTRFLKKYKI